MRVGWGVGRRRADDVGTAKTATARDGQLGSAGGLRVCVLAVLCDEICRLRRRRGLGRIWRRFRARPGAGRRLRLFLRQSGGLDQRRPSIKGGVFVLVGGRHGILEHDLVSPPHNPGIISIFSTK